MHKSWMKRQSRLGYLFIGPNMIGVLLFFIIPAVYSFYLMFTDYKFMSPETTFCRAGQYPPMLNDDLFGVALRNTFVFLLAVPVSMGLAFIVAVALETKTRRNWQKTLRALYFMPYITSGVAIAFVWDAAVPANIGTHQRFFAGINITNPPGWLSTTEWSMISMRLISLNLVHAGVQHDLFYLAALQENPGGIS